MAKKATKIPAAAVAAMQEKCGKPRVLACILTRGTAADLVATMLSLERSIERAIALDELLAARVMILSIGGDWWPLNDVAGHLSRIYPHIESVQGYRMEAHESDASAIKHVQSGASGGIMFLVKAGAVLAPGCLSALLAAMRQCGASLACARRLPDGPGHDGLVRLASHVHPSCTATDLRHSGKLGELDCALFPSHLYTVDLSWRARAAGLTSITVPSAAFYMEGPADPALSRRELMEETIVLAHKFSHLYLRDQLLADCAASGDQATRDISHRFDYRLSNGMIPAPVAAFSDFADFSAPLFSYSSGN